MLSGVFLDILSTIQPNVQLDLRLPEGRSPCGTDG